MNIDIGTIVFLILAANILTAALVFSYTYKSPHLRSNVVFLIAKLVQSIVWPLVMLRDIVPPFFSILVANFLLITAVSLEAWALISLKRRFQGWIARGYLVLLTIQFLTFTASYIWFNNEQARVFIFSFGTALVMIGPLIIFIHGKLTSALEYLFTVIYSLVVVFFIFRSINALAGFIPVSVTATHWYNQLMYTLVFCHTILVNTGFILLNKERDDGELKKIASIDQLTNISNRRTFLEESNKCIAKARDGKQPISMLMFDIDDFKHLNDEYGHMIGDEVLVEIAELAKDGLRDCQSIGRFGGDEFAILLPGSDEAESDSIAASILEKVKHQRFTKMKLELAISVGVVTLIPDKTTTFDTYYRWADEGLYLTKKATKSAYARATIRK